MRKRKTQWVNKIGREREREKEREKDGEQIMRDLIFFNSKTNLVFLSPPLRFESVAAHKLICFDNCLIV